MLDFLIVSTKLAGKNGPLEVYPRFIIKRSKDLMVRGSDFYAIWDEEKKLWSTDEHDAVRLIDKEIETFVKENKNKFAYELHPKYMWDSSSGVIDSWHKYCQKQMRESYHQLDERLIFSNDEVDKNDYASKKLSYPLEPCDISAYDKIMSTLYSPEERDKIEWAIGSIVTGDSKNIQKFIVLYGSAGTGKSTVLNIIQQLFDGYHSVFDAKALGSSSNVFALEAFKTNPLVAIQHDGDLSKIEDNTRINSLVSHEYMTVNEKYKSTYTNKFNAFLFMGTNRPVKITDSKSGLIRRLIDVSPSGNRLSPKEYNQLIGQIKFELGGIACHCRDVYLANPGRYDNYIPVNMLGASNDFYNFVEDSYFVFKENDETTLKTAWEMYKTYCADANVPYPYSQRVFKEELKNYFSEFKERGFSKDGTRIRNYYSGFIFDKFESFSLNQPVQKEENGWLKFQDDILSVFDKEYSDCPAQYATDEGTPYKSWDKVSTKLRHLDTSLLHYVLFPEKYKNHIVVDFDFKDENGNKDYNKNLEEASKWPKTYAELSKSGGGIHLHYIYTGDVETLSRIYDDNIEIKIFTGKSSLRRKLTKCNDLPISEISSGLPLKGDDKVVNFEALANEKAIITMIKRNLRKEYHPGTKPSIDFIYKILNDAYESGISYDVTKLRNSIFGFAANSTNHADYCMKLVNQMKFKSEDYEYSNDYDSDDIVFFDVEVFPNLFLVNWKVAGKDKPIIRMINPTPAEIEALVKRKLVGFNNLKYDNHILYGRIMGFTNEQLYKLSQKIIVERDRNAFFNSAYGLSYTDIYDYSAKKQSLKKWEIELGISHKELGFSWDEPVPEDKWILVSEYCDNDVLATEAVFNATNSDFLARQILADLANGTVNETTNQLTTKIIFGNEKHPQSEFKYRDMGEVSDEDTIAEGFDEYTRFNKDGKPVFPGYTYEYGKSSYRDVEEVGEGGYVYSEPGMYGYVALLDIASMHPSSAIAEWIFGRFTKLFEDLKLARIHVKHLEWAALSEMLNGKLAKYVPLIQSGKVSTDSLSLALKIAINSVYGLTSARFPNAFKDPRNVDNIVAKRGSLFMINLRHEVQKRGFIVAHIKTDSIKIPDATLEIIEFVMAYGKMYGYDFEHEATYDRMCLVNNAVYIAKYLEADKCKELYGYVPEKCAKKGGQWTATGTQFQVPYVFKTLFSKEDLEFDDFCETKSVAKGSLYLDMNENLPDVSSLEKERDKLMKKVNDPNMVNQYVGPECRRIDELSKDIEKGHNYIFVGRVGRFCPVKEGSNGGILYRFNEGKYYSVSGSKGYRWLESEVVKELDKSDCIDISYYDKLVDDAVNEISKYGDMEWFISNRPYIMPPFENGKPVYLDFGKN